MEATKRHPRILSFLVLTEMWERFGFYIVQGLLILYLTEFFGYSDNEGYSILGIFSAIVYISPFVGGLLADKLLGFEAAVVWGGFFLILGYGMLALPYPHALFYPALATIIIGNGLFKPNISSLLGTQYKTNDPKRDAGFTIFYIGINLGALLAGLSSGYIKQYVSFQMSFALAAIGLVIGLITFRAGLKLLKKNNKHSPTTITFQLKLLAYCLLAIIGLNFILRLTAIATWLLPATGILLLVFLTVFTLQQKAENRHRLIVLSTLIISSIVFWTLFLQIFFSANLFVERLVNKQLFGIPLTSTIFWGTESIFIVLLGPLFAWSWQVLGRNNKNPSPVSKFSLGIFIAGIGFVLLAMSTQFPDARGLISPYWVFLSYLFITIGELFISPIGLSAVTILAPAHLIGMMMGVWFVATGFGGIFAGMAAKLASIPEGMTNAVQKLAIYQNAFLDFAYLAFSVAIILFFVAILLQKKFPH